MSMVNIHTQSTTLPDRNEDFVPLPHTWEVT
jgi:hypothetical protein